MHQICLFCCFFLRFLRISIKYQWFHCYFDRWVYLSFLSRINGIRCISKDFIIFLCYFFVICCIFIDNSLNLVNIQSKNIYFARIFCIFLDYYGIPSNIYHTPPPRMGCVIVIFKWNSRITHIFCVKSTGPP